uniref:ABC transmembrane type-1 domain-containing protein n=1 Tax=Macrostomum lignano TaxID=282301 RepID=A0A1I8FT84_9PLAT
MAHNATDLTACFLLCYNATWSNWLLSADCSFNTLAFSHFNSDARHKVRQQRDKTVGRATRSTGSMLTRLVQFCWRWRRLGDQEAASHLGATFILATALTHFCLALQSESRTKALYNGWPQKFGLLIAYTVLSATGLVAASASGLRPATALAGHQQEQTALAACPEKTANYLSRLSFWMASAVSMKSVEPAAEQCNDEPKDDTKLCPAQEGSRAAMADRFNPIVLKVLFRMFAPSILLSVSLKLFYDLLNFSGTLILKAILKYLQSGPLQIVICLVLLYQELGPSIFAGVAVLIILIPINGVLAKYMKQFQVEQMELKDTRIKRYKRNTGRYSSQRHCAKKKSPVMRRSAFLNAGISFAWSCTPVLVSLATFSVYTLSSPDNILDAENTSCEAPTGSRKPLFESSQANSAGMGERSANSLLTSIWRLKTARLLPLLAQLVPAKARC